MIEIPDGESIDCVSDWIELTLALNKETLSKADIESILERNTGNEVDDGFLSEIWRELEYRNSLYSRHFFVVNERTISYQFETAPPNEYLACLLLSIFGVIGNTQTPGKLFEKLTRCAIESYLSGNAIVFGWPFEPIEGSEETAIKQKVKSIAVELNERFVESPHSRFKDRGLDVIGWITHEDRRSNQVVVLVQCAAGHNWKDKLPVPMEAWVQYIHWAYDPIRAFSVPCIIKEREWHDFSRDKGLLFDRIRLMNLLNNGLQDAEFDDFLSIWVQQQISIHEN